MKDFAKFLSGAWMTLPLIYIAAMAIFGTVTMIDHYDIGGGVAVLIFLMVFIATILAVNNLDD